MVYAGSIPVPGAMNTIEYNLISSAPDFRDCLLDYLQRINMTRAELADFIGISGAALHKILIYKKAKFSMDTFDKINETLGIETRKNGSYQIYEYGHNTTSKGKPINKSNLNDLESAFLSINQDLIDNDEHEIPVFELQEFIVAHETGLNTLIAALSPADKARINEIGRSDTLKNNIRAMHTANGELMREKTLLSCLELPHGSIYVCVPILMS